MHRLISNVLAPHYCCSCGRIGAVLCEGCKYDIVCEPYETCVLCSKLAKAEKNLCNTCRASFSYAWVVGNRVGALKEVIDVYKFERTRQAHIQLVSLLDAILPVLPQDIEIAPVPTVAKHIRARGYDHMQLISRELARKRGLTHSTPLRRATTTVQQGANRRKRHEQAQAAFKVHGVARGKRYLLIDDICTTGFTLEYAARTLREAGASEVWVAVIASQPLEKGTNI